MRTLLTCLLAPLVLLACAHSPSDLSVADSARLIAAHKGDASFEVLDVRTPGELAQGVIAGSRNIDFLAPDFKDRVAKLDRSKTYLVHCATGGRSKKAQTLMESLGFKAVYNMLGGFRAWAAAGEPVAKQPG
ncbi:MAG: rhodanese-like domain-containing protein [Elusimicrobia bacterium]|nr:rhodanese-like domain-containing protein [Elusimicrobiota bacterium]